MKKQFFLPFIFIMLLSSVFPSKAQYLSDTTEVFHLKNKYPSNEKGVLNLYTKNEIQSISFDSIFNMPEIEVNFGELSFPLTFDFGNSGNITLTNYPDLTKKYTVTDTVKTYTADGRIRGEAYKILIPEFIFFNKEFKNEKGNLMDWTISSSLPYNGLIGLKYFADQCFTLSYNKQKLAFSNHSIIPKLNPDRTDLIQMEHYKRHPYGIHFKGKINQEKVIVYFDTGKSVTMVNSDLLDESLISTDKSGSYYRGTVDIEFGSFKFQIYYPRVKKLRRSIKSDFPVGIEVGSDLLKYFLISVDRTAHKNILILHH